MDLSSLSTVGEGKGWRVDGGGLVEARKLTMKAYHTGIPHDLIGLLRATVIASCPDAILWVGARTVSFDSLQDRDRVVGALVDDLSARGLDENGEVNDYGLRMDRLIGIIAATGLGD